MKKFFNKETIIIIILVLACIGMAIMIYLQGDLI